MSVPDITLADFQLSNIAIPLDAEFEKSFGRVKHAVNMLTQDDQVNTFEYHAMEHLRLAAVYWGVMAVALLGGLHLVPKEEVLQFVGSCYDKKTGAYCGNAYHDPHLLYTQAAVQLLVLLDALDERVDKAALVKYVTSLQRPDGSFCGDKYGEVDTRFSYAALHTLFMLDCLPELTVEDHAAVRLFQLTGVVPAKKDGLDLALAVIYVLQCQNFDGGFGVRIGAETHAGQIFCCTSALSLAGAQKYLSNEFGQKHWLCSRQLPCGGLNGRPEKLEDVCYSWWVLSSMSTLHCVGYIDGAKLTNFILSSQDLAEGGISERPDMMTDSYHTYFGIAGLSLLGNPGFEPIDPVLALPKFKVEKYIDQLYSRNNK